MPKRSLKKKTYYHVYNRGWNKQQLFFFACDFQRFWETFLRYREDYKMINIHVWCFLPNHFHLLISEEEGALKPGLELPDAEQISHFMNRIQQAYAMYFNSKYAESVKQGKKAPVFEGRFKAKEITDEEYLARVTFYVRHNAVKHEIVDRVEDWPWAGSTKSENFPVMDYTGIDAEFDPGFK